MMCSRPKVYGVKSSKKRFFQYFFTSTLLMLVCGCYNQRASKSNMLVSELQLELERKLENFGSGIKSFSIAQGGATIVISDGTVLGDHETDLLVLSARDFSRIKTFAVTDEMCDDYPWSSKSLALNKNGTKVLLYNQYISLENNKTIIALNVKDAVGMVNVNPEPTSISPNGRLALVMVGSFSSYEYSSLAVFDLATGKHIKVLAKGKNIDYGSSCFIDNNRIVSSGYDGETVIYDLRTGNKIRVAGNGPSPPLWEGKNLGLLPFNAGKYLLISGSKEIAVLDIEKKKFVWRQKSQGGNALLCDNKGIIIWQTLSKHLKRSGCHHSGPIPERVLAITNIFTKKRLAEIRLGDKFLKLMQLGKNMKYLFAADHDDIYKFKIDLPASAIQGK